MEKYDRIGIDYNQTRKADPYLFGRMLDLLAPSKDGIYLDIGCGTGNYTKEFDKLGYPFIGIEPSQEMFIKAKATPSNIKFKQGKAEAIDLPDNSVHGVLATLTIHHWQDLNKAFSEIKRVLKPQGRFLMFTATPEQMEGYWLNNYFPKMLKDSSAVMPTLQVIEKHLNTNGLHIKKTEPYLIHEGLQDLFLNSGKHNPSQYFKPNIRKGISAFAAIANKEEVAQGLQELENDSISGKIDQVIAHFNTLDKGGDYLYIVAQNVS